MIIPPNTVRQIFESVQIEDIVGEFVPLKKRGSNLLGLCPFHDEKTPSFTVSPGKNIYKCFGCGKAGNAVNFLMELEHFSYPEALKYIANKYNIAIKEIEETEEQKQAKDEQESIYAVLDFAKNYFKKTLHEHPEGKKIALSYLKERGFSDKIIGHFDLGYNLPSWTALTEYAVKSGYQIDLLEKAGLAIVKENRQFDRFNGRVIFPIHNLSGRVIGFGGRVMKQTDKTAKYINSPESEVYNKSQTLYGIYFAKNEIIKQDNCYLVEGYTDVISLYQSDVKNVVASSGTSLTEGQIKLIRRYTKNITVLYDSDPAGIKASFRGTDMILEQGMNVKIVLFPEGEDPDSFASKHSASELQSYFQENEQDFISFKTKLLLSGINDDPIQKAKVVQDIIQSIALIPNQVLRLFYIKQCAEMMSITEKILINEMNKAIRRVSKSTYRQMPVYEHESETSQKPEAVAADNLCEVQEKNIIRLLLNYYDHDFEIEVEEDFGRKRKIKVRVIDFIVKDLAEDNLTFENNTYQQIFDAFQKAVEHEEEIEIAQFTNHTDEDLKKASIHLITEKYILSDNWEKIHKIQVVKEPQILHKACVTAILSFKAKKTELMMKALHDKMKDGKEENMDSIISQYQNVKKMNQMINQALGRIIIK